MMRKFKVEYELATTWQSARTFGYEPARFEKIIEAKDEKELFFKTYGNGWTEVKVTEVK